MIIIYGANRGIGKYLTEQYGLEAVGFGHDECEITDIEDVEVTIDRLVELDYDLTRTTIINCAVANTNVMLHKSEGYVWEKEVDVTIKGMYNILSSWLPIMRSNHYGRIVAFSSVVAQKGIPGTSAYATGKAALWGLTKSVAAENASKGITMNCINLGYSDIGLGTLFNEEQRKAIIDAIPMKRFCQPEEIFRTVNYIISTEYLTGTSIDLNGGYL